MYGTFSGCSNLTDISPLRNWNTSNVTDMQYLFKGCSKITSLEPISDWKTFKLQSTNYMFSWCSGLTSLEPIKRWNTSNIMNMEYMFYGCSKLKDVDLSAWNTAAVQSMRGIFTSCSSLETLDISGWSTLYLTNCEYMFNGSSKLKTIYVSDCWDLTNASAHSYMFSGCDAIVGQNDTHYNSSYTNKTYARVDTEETPGYLTYKGFIRTVKRELVNSEDKKCILEKVDDDTWTYTFTGLDPNRTYYAWEDYIDKYKSVNMGQNNYLTIKSGSGTITNTTTVVPPTYGKLRIAKNVLNKDGSSTLNDLDKQRTFLFTVTLTDSEGAALTENLLTETMIHKGGENTEGSMAFIEGKASFRLADDDNILISGIPSDYNYSVEETAEEGFDAQVTTGPASGTITANQTKMVVITNTKNYDEAEEDITVTLKKEVTGNVVDPDEEFSFTMDLSGLRKNAVYEISSNKHDSIFAAANSSGMAYVELKLVKDEAVTFTVPKDSTYCVTELAGNYTSSYKITDSAGLNHINKSKDTNSSENTALSTRVETADEGEQVEIVFTNVKNVRQKLVLSKQLSNASDGNTDLFGFTVNMWGLPESTVITSSLGRIVVPGSGSVSLEFTLAGGKTAEFDNIPVGAGYEIIEAASDYKASCEILYGNEVQYSIVNDEPDKEITTGRRTIEVNKDPKVVFTNQKLSCDVTVTNYIDMTYGILRKSEYKNIGFDFEIQLTGYSSANKKYSEVYVEYTKEDTVGAERRSLASLLGLYGAEAEQIVDDTRFTITLYHGESFKIKSVPYGADCYVTEKPSASFIADYIVKANDGAVLQTEAQANTVVNRALSLNAPEYIDISDTDIEFIFTNRYEFQPYTLPAAGRNDSRYLIIALFAGMILCASVYLLSRRRKA